MSSVLARIKSEPNAGPMSFPSLNPPNVESVLVPCEPPWLTSGSLSTKSHIAIIFIELKTS